MKSHAVIHAPLLWPAVCLMAGIIVITYWAVPWLVWPWLAACVVMTALLFHRPVVQTFMLGVDFLLVGMVLIQRQPAPVGADQCVEAVVFSAPVEKPKTMAVELLLPENGQRVRRYLWKDDRSRALRLGDAVVLQRLNEGFVPGRDWSKGGQATAKISRLDRVRLRFLQMRQGLLGRYRQSVEEEEAYSVLAAMALGDKSALTSEVRKTYSATGASHVLALSGLHLGIIYMLLSGLAFGRRRFWLGQSVIVTCIWAFAFLTGLSPSIVRSATMISIYAIFSVGGRGRSSLNLLAFTAIVILLFDPSALFDMGFQLSFMAVLSILLFMPLVERYWPVKSWIHRWLRGMVGVSVAAQLGVAPLIAYYFGHFSPYFLLTNFIVIPAVTIILYGALLVILIPQLGNLLSLLIQMLNKALGWIAQLPCSSIDGLHPSVFKVCMLYVLLLAIYLITLYLSRVKYHSGLPQPSTR